jgi:ribonucleoside-diphosphate reductase alpha chain
MTGRFLSRALISLSNLSDQRLAKAKSGEWYLSNPERALANNSVAYTSKPDLSAFLEEMQGLYRSKAGERGIINKVALRKKAESSVRVYAGDYLVNPCVEAILRDSGV